MGTVLLAALGCLVVTGVSAGQIWGRTAPELALRFWPVTHAAQAQRASQLAVDPAISVAGRRESDHLARISLAGDPTDVAAIRTRGLLAGIGGDAATARRWMAFSQALSRRDLPTQLWFIEDAVGRNDIDAALTHYDRALRTSRQAPDILFPVLIGAVTEPAVADKLSRLIAQRPNWWGAFMNRLIGEVSDPDALVPFARRLRLTATDPDHPDFLPRILQRLVAGGNFKAAGSLARASGPARGSALLYNGGFEQDGDLLPFGWRMVDDADLSARIEPRPDGAPGRALILEARNGRTGVVAMQAAALATGRYVLSGEGGDPNSDPRSRATIQVRCGTADGTSLGHVALPPVARGRISMPFAVPAGCPGVWIMVEARASEGQLEQEARPWIDNLSVAPAR